MTLVCVGLMTGCAGTTADPVPDGQSGRGLAVVQPAGADPQGGTGDSAEEWPPVRLDDVGAARSDPAPERRNPFRFGAARPPSLAGEPGGGGRQDPAAAPVAGIAPSGAAQAPVPGGGPAGIPLTFIGFVESPGIEGRVVVLTNGEDPPFHGREGDVIDGRYRIIGIGLESVDLERIDGLGQVTLRLPDESAGGQ